MVIGAVIGSFLTFFLPNFWEYTTKLSEPEIINISPKGLFDWYFKIENEFDREVLFKKNYKGKVVEWTGTIERFSPNKFGSEGVSVEWVDQEIRVIAMFNGKEAEKTYRLNKGKKVTVRGKIGIVYGSGKYIGNTIISLVESRLINNHS